MRRLLCLLGSVSTYVYAKQDVRANFGDHKVVELLKSQLTEDVKQLLHEHHGDHLNFNHEESKLSVKVNPALYDKLTERNLDFQDVTEHWVAQMQKNLDDPELFCTDGTSTCASRSMQNFFSQYQDLESILERINGLVNSSDVAEMIVIGSSSEGRDINLVEIGDQSLPLVYFMCNIHAREWLTPMYCTYMIENLLADGGHALLDQFSFAIIPSGNPDGYEFSRTVDNLWRKTRNINQGSSCIGTDANRNYNNNFGGAGTSRNPCSEIFRGLAPFSTPEAAAVNNYGQLHRDRLISWTDFHSFAGEWLSPLGFTTGEPPAEDYDRMLQCMQRAVAAVEAETGQLFDAGPAGDLAGVAAGASDDYHYFEYGVIYSFTVEMRGPNFQPPTEDIDPAMRETFAGMVAQMECIAEIEFADSNGTGGGEGDSDSSSHLVGVSAWLAGLFLALAL